MLVAVLRSPGKEAIPTNVPGGPGITWAAGKQVAPGFSLRDQNGRSISLEQFHGRPVIVTFIDPLCRNLCPLEAKVLGRVAASFPAGQRPAIVAVSTNRWADARRNLLQDVQKWNLPRDWHWAVGAPSALARVWKDYSIGVSVKTKKIAGVTGAPDHAYGGVCPRRPERLSAGALPVPVPSARRRAHAPLARGCA